MKKLIVLGAFLTFVVISASAQVGIRDRASHQRTERGFDRGQLSRPREHRRSHFAINSTQCWPAHRS